MMSSSSMLAFSLIKGWSLLHGYNHSLSLCFCSRKYCVDLVTVVWFGSCISQPIALPVPSEHLIYANSLGPRDWAVAPGPRCHCRFKALKQSDTEKLDSCAEQASGVSVGTGEERATEVEK